MRKIHDATIKRNLSNYRFKNVEFVSVTFDGCILEKTVFEGCVLVGCTFRNCCLASINFRDCHVSAGIL